MFTNNGDSEFSLHVFSNLIYSQSSSQIRSCMSRACFAEP